MSSSQVKNSRGKIVPRSDLRVGTTGEVRNVKDVKDVKEYKRISTWNVKTLLQCGKLENLKLEMDKMKIDILGISGIRLPKSGDFLSGDHRIIYTGASKKKPGTGGVKFIINKTLRRKVKGYIQYDDRIIRIKLQTKPKDTIVV